jgi:membrane protein DedA with SNARE-associated domain
LGVITLMALESSIFPIPSELVIPPAAVICLRDRMPREMAILLVLLVILAGVAGSFLGASITYWVSRILGRPLVLKYGKYLLITEKKLRGADRWMIKYGSSGIFIARLLPVVRHLISIPAGIIGMRYYTFSLMTLLGSFLWCTVLALFGIMMRHEMWAIIAQQGHFTSAIEQQIFQHALNNLTLAMLGLVGIAMGGYWWFTHHQKTAIAQTKGTDERHA